jgi:hypothetical protein
MRAPRSRKGEEIELVHGGDPRAGAVERIASGPPPFARFMTIPDRIASLATYLRSVRDSRIFRGRFDSVETYVMFVGYPRSGHSLIGALLNAHRSMLISHELDALKYLRRGASRQQLCTMIWWRNREFVNAGYRWSGYDYEVPGQWQDSCESVRVIGDKKGGRSALRLCQRPELLARLRETIELPIRVIHVMRDPFDNIATIAARDRTGIAQATERYRRHCQGVEVARQRTKPEEFLELRYEDFVADVKARLNDLCGFVGQASSEDYLDACASRVFASASRTRDTVAWTATEREGVERVITEFPFLHGYATENATHP